MVIRIMTYKAKFFIGYNYFSNHVTIPPKSLALLGFNDLYKYNTRYYSIVSHIKHRQYLAIHGYLVNTKLYRNI